MLCPSYSVSNPREGKGGIPSFQSLSEVPSQVHCQSQGMLALFKADWDLLRLVYLRLGCASAEGLRQKYKSSPERLITRVIPRAWAATTSRRRWKIPVYLGGTGYLL
jgi:hypothetical protein